MKKGSVLVEYVTIVVLAAAVVCGGLALQEARVVKAKQDKLRHSKVVLYEGPKSLRDATEEDLQNVNEEKRDFSLLHCTDTFVTVNGQDCYVYDTNVNHTRSWFSNYLPPQSRTPVAYFDFEGAVDIQVSVPNIELEDVQISPLSYGIEPMVDADAHTVAFRIDTPDNYTIQFNHSPERAVHIFANPLETEEEIPNPDDPNVIYIGPGEWEMDSISLSKGQVLYLAGGSVVHSTVNANFVSDVTVCGRGILDGSQYEGWKGRSAYVPLKFSHCNKAVVKDIIVLNSNAWVVEVYDSENGVIDGLHIISSRPNGDGISIQSCQNYIIDNCFVRTWDDSLVVKNYDTNSSDIIFRNTQVWTDLAQSMEIGFETNKGNHKDAAITNVVFEGITVLNNFHKPVISVHNGDDALLDGITFKDITVEYEEVGSGDSDLPYLIDISIVQNNNWSTTTERGTIRNVTLDNVNFLAGNDKYSRVLGYDAAHKVEDVLFKNLTMFGTEAKTLEDAQIKVNEETVSHIEMQ
ncbi:MAG: hypothetical protein IJ833_00520 [Lachnospiraceae bacterium]|nr:hypothetical protein [Lachnospiraceae bacterium]